MLEQTIKEKSLKKQDELFLTDVLSTGELKKETPACGHSSLFQSFCHALRGLGYALSTQRNLRIQIVAGASVLIAGFFYRVSMLEMLLLWLAIVLVIACEIINTALELTLDIVSGGKFHSLVKITKDVVAAGVLLAAINAVIIGTIIFAKYV